MARATWNGVTIAESDATVVVDGNHYFPPDSVDFDVLRETATETTCGWKGVASYYSIVAGGAENEDAAWVYRSPEPEAENIRGHLAFWKGVEVAG